MPAFLTRRSMSRAASARRPTCSLHAVEDLGSWTALLGETSKNRLGYLYDRPVIADALAARQEGIGRAIAQRVVAEIPEYARAPEEVVEDLVEGATATAGLLARAFDGRLERD